MISYREPVQLVSNVAEVFIEMFLQSPSSLIHVQAVVVSTTNAIHNILRLRGEVVTDVMCQDEKLCVFHHGVWRY